jgi:signal transduction histidine kinase
MRRYVERELVRSRAGPKVVGGSSYPVLPIVQGIVSVLSRLPAGRSLDFAIDIPQDLSVDVDPQDLTEMVGTLGENATKWARSRVVFSARADAGCLSIFVEDDGPGIPENQRATALSRGGRLPRVNAGSGLGLAILRDVCDVYGGVVCLEQAELGGLKAEVRLPVR